jgi:hypothetical protein
VSRRPFTARWSSFENAPTQKPSKEASADDDIDTLLARAAAGEQGAQDRLFAASYADLKQLARARLRSHRQQQPRPPPALQATG